MAIFPTLLIEDVVQVGDRTRLSAIDSGLSKGEAAITLVEIEPEASAGFIDVTGTKPSDRFTDWEYATNGIKVVSCRITTDGAPTTTTKTLQVLTAVDDKLFSADADLLPHEKDIMKYTTDGRVSFLDVHRKAQALILAWLDERGIHDSDGNRLTKDSILDLQEVKEWAKYMVLRLIFQSNSNSANDVFDLKAKSYEVKEADARTRNIFKFDWNNDGKISDNELTQFHTAKWSRA